MEPLDCTRCGACCAAFRVSFHWAREDLSQIPESSLELITPFISCMAGTNQQNPRCVHLDGEVGQSVTCSIYALRPSPCREVSVGDAKCIEARSHHGLDVTEV